MTDDPKVKSLAKAMQVLECFSTQAPELGISDIARMTGMQKSSVHNILSTFAQIGYVGKNEQTNRYHLGLALLRYSYIITNHMGLHKLLLPYLKRIANEIGETCYLGIMDHGSVLYIESCVSEAHVPTRNILGERAPLYCTGLGKALLAYAPEALEFLDAPYAPFTANTLCDRAALEAEMQRTRERGYAIDDMEHEFGIKCVALPVFNHVGQPVCAVSVSGPSLRFSSARIDTIAGTMRDILTPVQGKI